MTRNWLLVANLNCEALFRNTPREKLTDHFHGLSTFLATPFDDFVDSLHLHRLSKNLVSNLLTSHPLDVGAHAVLALHFRPVVQFSNRRNAVGMSGLSHRFWIIDLQEIKNSTNSLV